MKEIDFIPEWYKADRKRKRRYVRQSTMVAVMFTVMMVWGFLADRYVARVRADVQEIQDAFEKGQMRVTQVLELQNQIEIMKQKTSLLEKVTPRTKITAVLAEVSCLIQDSIVLSELTLGNEDIEQIGKNKPLPSDAVVQIGSAEDKKEDTVVPQVPSRMRVTMSGIAAEPADAALLIARLEQSPYFDGVALVFSRPKTFNDKNVTEFKIRCYVADYQVRK